MYVKKFNLAKYIIIIININKVVIYYYKVIIYYY